jgi:hypothetical protein
VTTASLPIDRTLQDINIRLLGSLELPYPRAFDFEEAQVERILKLVPHLQQLDWRNLRGKSFSDRNIATLLTTSQNYPTGLILNKHSNISLKMNTMLGMNPVTLLKSIVALFHHLVPSIVLSPITYTNLPSLLSYSIVQTLLIRAIVVLQWSWAMHSQKETLSCSTTYIDDPRDLKL